jgi:hypothetical protein
MRRKRHHGFDDYGGRGAHSRGIMAIGAGVAFGLALRGFNQALQQRSNNGPLEVDCSGSTCFESVEWSDGVASYVFRDGYTDDFPMDRSEFRDWQTDGSPGGFFNEAIRPLTVKGSNK